MGGKNPTIVLDDADLHLAVRLAVVGGFGFTGQRCTATSRVIVEEGIADRFAAALVEAANALKVGDGLEAGVQMGPAVNEDQLETELDYVRIGGDEGAELLAGGGGPATAATSAADRLRRRRRHSRFAQEEIFGPVVGIIRARDLDDALFKANAVGYGLAASVVTNDLHRAMSFVDRIEAGVVKVNEPTTGLALQAPFGGFKQSSANTFKEQGRRRSSSTCARRRSTSPTVSAHRDVSNGSRVDDKHVEVQYRYAVRGARDMPSHVLFVRGLSASNSTITSSRSSAAATT